MAQEKIKGQWLQKINDAEEALLYAETSADQVIYSIENEGLSNETIVTVKDKLDNILGEGGTVATAQVANAVTLSAPVHNQSYRIPLIESNDGKAYFNNSIIKATIDTATNKSTITADTFSGTATNATVAESLEFTTNNMNTTYHLLMSTTPTSDPGGSDVFGAINVTVTTDEDSYDATIKASKFEGDLVGTAEKAEKDVDGYAIKDWYPRLNTEKKIPATFLPSYVDDVVEGTYRDSKFYTSDNSVITPEAGKVYVDTSTNKTYRWSGTQYVEISSSLALGETSSTAYAGDKGKANANAITGLQTRMQTAEQSISAMNGGLASISSRVGIAESDIDALQSAKWVEVGDEGQTNPSDSLVIGGLFFKRTA